MQTLPIIHPGPIMALSAWFAAKAESIRATEAMERAHRESGNDPAKRWALGVPDLEDEAIAADERLAAVERYLPPLA